MTSLARTMWPTRTRLASDRRPAVGRLRFLERAHALGPRQRRQLHGAQVVPEQHRRRLAQPHRARIAIGDSNGIDQIRVVPGGDGDRGRRGRTAGGVAQDATAGSATQRRPPSTSPRRDLSVRCHPAVSPNVSPGSQI